jgi:methylated-DNA-[protein]-cysteine S-methyltransferase
MDKVYVGKADPTPLGPVWVALSDRGLLAVEIGATQFEFFAFLQNRRYGKAAWQPVYDPDRTVETTRQIQDYLAGERREFDLDIDWSAMTAFQQAALHLTLSIPYGQVSTYGEIARQLGRPLAARAVGRAEATNPMPLVIPCHRVLGTDGGLHGYGAPGGVKTKAWLLELESR